MYKGRREHDLVRNCKQCTSPLRAEKESVYEEWRLCREVMLRNWQEAELEGLT